ncbi:hypothetical protein H5399_05255 [Tessaracoccus sp. MC1627]|uniref:hypothetical protein n=1 Tax=Tessaracoccus sp. MC1627 TaxID=2760312 RepID=UPI001601B124|nr:hypothetical protein [Tessaracoccus sp. MC1627]MBB1512012.1 hypothetical protein [Tessaracoccus sp. MC1627]
MSCDGTGTLGCRGCSVCADHRSGAPATHRSSTFPSPALRTPEWLAEMKGREERLTRAPAGQRWAQTIVPEPEY